MRPRCLLLLLMVGACSGGSSTPAGCPDGYLELPDLESCYRVPSEVDTWVNARTICAAEDATLPIPDSGYEALAIATVMSNAGMGASWIGLSDIESDGTWVTVLGVEATFQPWDDFEPDGNTSQNCARLNENGRMSDEGCAQSHGFSCELAR